MTPKHTSLLIAALFAFSTPALAAGGGAGGGAAGSGAAASGGSSRTTGEIVSTQWYDCNRSQTAM